MMLFTDETVYGVLMNKAILFLPDGMADEPLEERGGRTPLEAVDTPWMDRIAEDGANGTFVTLPDGFPTSSDVANMSVLGYDLAKCYPGRGPLEAVSQDIDLRADDVAFRCNLVTVEGVLLMDYSAGHIPDDVAARILYDLQREFGSDRISFHHGVSYRNLIVLHGSEFSDKVNYFKPDSSQGENVNNLKLYPADDSAAASFTVEFLEAIIEKTRAFLVRHQENLSLERPANMIWPWSPGRKPELDSFSQKYNGLSGAVISAVDVIFGIAKCAGMDVIKVPGATGFIDTNYEGKAAAAIKALEDHDFVYLHVEATDECSHMGDLKLKMEAIENFENRIVKPVMQALKGENVSYAILPDHPVPIRLRKHTRTPVPFAVMGRHIQPDDVKAYSESQAGKGALGLLQKDELMKLLLNLSH